MAFYYVAQQEAQLRKKGEHLAIEVEGKVVAEPLLGQIDTLVLLGRPRISQEAQLALLDQGASVAYLSRAGHFKGRLVPASHKNALLRQRQHAAFADTTRVAGFVRATVARKLRNACAVLYAYQRNAHNSFAFPQRPALRALIEQVEAAESVEIDTLRGWEGAGSRLYFEGFAQCLEHGVVFPGRRYRPSADGVNSMLSMGYSLLARELESLLEAAGLDPYIGYYHTAEYGRASLSLDLMEEFRQPWIDRLVLGLFNHQQATPEDFEFRSDGKEGQLYMKPETLRMFLGAYESSALKEFRLGATYTTWRKLMRHRVEQLRRSLLDGEEWRPFAWEEDTACAG